MNKRALITGSSSGIGFAYARYLSKKDWNLDLISHDNIRSERSEIELDYKKASFYIADLSKIESIKNIVDNFETPDLIVANAGVAINGSIGKLTRAEKEDAYYLMCGGVIDLIQKYIPHLSAQKNSRVVIISSIGAISPMPKSSIYSSAKAAIYAYGRSLNEELKNVSITVSLPGYVKTDIHLKSGLDHLNKKIPSWMWVTAEKVVYETEKASIKGKSSVIPGIVYKLASPILGSNLANRAWRSLSRRN